ncbi:MAG: hypothetical protein ACJA0G_000387 [Kangiellaceae bacterium]|jgi:hypothetical protein
MQSKLLIKGQPLGGKKPINGPDLSPYRQVIQGLAPLVHKPIFNNEFERQTKAISSDLRFLVKMEVKRLAKPCIRSIDIRTIVKDECRLFTHHGIDHYLNVIGILSFEKLIKRYSEYTFGVYEGVLEEAHKEKDQRLVVTKKGNTLAELVLPEEKYIVPCQELLNFPTRKQERLNYVVAVEVFFPDNSSAHASTLDISINGLRIKLKEPQVIQKLKTFKPLKIVFRGVNKQHGLSRESIEYQVSSISGTADKANVHLYREASSGDLFDTFVSDLIKLNKHRYKVNLDNVEMAMASKIYEQSFANTTPTLPVFVCRDENDFYHAQYASMNSHSKHLLDYWTDEKGNNLLGFLLNPARIYQLLNNSSAYPQMTIYCFNHVKDEKVYFYSATPKELAKHPELADTFFGYGSRKVSWRVYQITCSNISPQDAFSPTSIPDGINKKIDRLNRGISPRLQSRLNNISNMLSITDITCETGQQCYQNRRLSKHKIKLLKAFGHARNKLPVLLQSFRHKQQELRRQTRYILRTKIILTSNTQYITGITEDISVSGLKIELDEPFTQRMNSKVELSFVRLQEITQHFELKHLQYRVVHININKQVLHLQAVALDEMSVAEHFFTQLITNNSDKLMQVLVDEPVPGIGAALRNLHSKNSPQFCAYIEKTQQGFLPAMATVSQVRAKWMDFLHNDKSLALINVAWMYQDIGDGKDLVNQSLKVLKVDPSAIKTEIYVATPRQHDVGVKIAKAKWQYEFTSHRAKKSFIKQALKAGDFFAFNITINKALKPDLEKIEQELLYLSQHAIHKATYFEERMWDIAGALFLTDITPEVLYRYDIENDHNE